MSFFSQKYKSIFCGLICFLMLLLSPISVFASGNNYKFSDIDLKLTIPSDLIVITRTTTNNNSYLKKLGANNANEIQASMTTNHVYLEAFDENIDYEIAVIGQKASDSLENFDEISENELNLLFNDYIQSEKATVSDYLIEDMTDSYIKQYNNLPYFITEVTSHTADNNYVYTQKAYTVKRGYVYIYSLQADNMEISEKMRNDFDSIINSCEYVNVKKSLSENGIFSEIMSTIITALVPIAILLLIVYLISHLGKKSTDKALKEEAALREQYKAAKNDNNQDE